MEIICLGFLLGIVFSIVALGAGVFYYDRVDKRKHYGDYDKPIFDFDGHRDRNGNQSDHIGLDDEAVKGILTVMRMSVRYSEAERLAIDYCIDRLEAENG